MSSSLLFSMLLKMDAGQAKAELASFTAATTKMGKEVGDLPTKVRPAKDAVDGLGSAYTSAGQASDKSAMLMARAALAASRADLLRLKSTDGATKADIAAAQAAYNKANALDAAASAALAVDRANNQMARSATNLGRTNQQAAGSVGNLVAQFNDVGMMIAAGQNPLQLAIQQGTQISQVIGPMGAAGATRALGSAFVGMLNPINLVTFAVLAGGAAIVQWAMSGEEAGKSFEDILKDVDDALAAIERYDSIDLFAGMSTHASVIRTEFENILGIVRQVEAANLQASLRNLKINNPLTQAVIDFQADASVLAQMGVAVPDFNVMGLDRLYEAKFVLAAMADIQGQTREELLKSLDAAAERITLIGYMTPEVQQQLALIAEQLGLEKEINAARQDAVDTARDATQNNERDRATAAEMLADLQAEADLNAVIAQYGAQSTEATAMRAEQERAAYVEKVNSLNVTDAMRVALLAAYDEAQALAGVDFVSGIGAGADEAARLGGNLAEAANAWLAARSAAQEPGRLALGKYGSRGTVVNRPIEDGAGEVIRFNPAPSNSGRSGVGAGAANKEAESVGNLIEKLQGEVEILRELDPVQREMAQYRDQLTGATDAESAAVEELISLRQQEKQETEQLEYIQTQTGNALVDALMGGVDAGEQLIKTLMRAALQATLLGEGPLAGLFGGGGGLLGPLFSVFGGGANFASGGMIYGAGGPRDDMVPINASPGEFIVNARATQRHRALLEQLNSGQLASAPAFANGGMIGGSPSPSSGAPMGGAVFNAHFDLRGAQGDSAVQEAAKRGMDAALKEFARSELPSHVRRMSADPTVVRYG